MKKKLPYKILFVGAMETELRSLLKTFNAQLEKKLLNIFPLFRSSYKHVDVFIVETFVGDVNASIAGYEALREIKPDLVIKFGAVGGSYPESQAGDITIPLGFFHRTAWITKHKRTSKPSNKSEHWQSVFGKLPYQVNSQNLGGLPYYFPVNPTLIKLGENLVRRGKMKYETAYIGGGNMWMFSKKMLNNVAEIMLPLDKKHKQFVSDMESYALAHACFITKTPFWGCYTVASNDYLDEPYDPLKVPVQMEALVPYALALIDDYFRVYSNTGRES